MKTWKIATIIGLATVIVALLASSASGYMGPYGSGGTYGGMMGRGGMNGGYRGYYTNPQNTAQQGTTIYQSVFPFQLGGGCVGRFGINNVYAIEPYTNTGAQLNITIVKTIAENYIGSINNPDLTMKQVEEYSNNFYLQVIEKSTGKGAFELLINKYTGVTYPEMGPNMIWNTKYGMMRGGILGGIFGNPSATTTVTVTQATATAQQYLNTNLPGTTIGDISAFYGYYTIEVLNASNPFGMLSVNGYTGQVWYHTWHGTFVQELQLG